MRNLKVDPDALRRFCLANHMERLAFFGSVLREDFGPDSDVDILVRFAPGAHVTLLDIARMEREFSVLVGGRRVDLRTAEDLSRRFRQHVVETAEVAHAAG